MTPPNTIMVQELNRDNVIIHEQEVTTFYDILPFISFFYDGLYNPFDNNVSYIKFTLKKIGVRYEVYTLKREENR